ncbi:hypothetical protein KHQ82_03375 [Mycoplasmatota bacterium]|nr:hypothetical protein KHQ82_03375 [Mycoplasmatota bacterium]
MEYKKKIDTKEYRTLFFEAYKYVNSVIDDYSFYFRLIGSAKRNLVLDKPNKGFDFDYQIIFYQSLVGEGSDKLIEIKDRFRHAFDDFFVEKGYEYGEDSTSAITIKMLDGDKIYHSYDVTLMTPNSVDKLCIFKYNDNEKTEMGLNEMRKSAMFKEKYKKIKGAQKWKELRDEYKIRQEEWNGERKSFSILMSVVNDMKL